MSIDPGPSATDLRCPVCEYLLTGLTSPRCPECGTPVDWDAAREMAGHPGLPLDRARGWARLLAALRTWAMVLFQPRRFADQLSERSSVWPATFFAAACLAVGTVGNELIENVSGFGTSWALTAWFHLEIQSILFTLVSLPRRHIFRGWMFWRKVSLYTTAFVALEFYWGPPFIGTPLNINFFWLLDPDAWLLSNWARFLPMGSSWPWDFCGYIWVTVLYYWWMIVLGVTLWRRLPHRGRIDRLGLILLAMPVITAHAFPWLGELFSFARWLL